MRFDEVNGVKLSDLKFDDDELFVKIYSDSPKDLSGKSIIRIKADKGEWFSNRSKEDLLKLIWSQERKIENFKREASYEKIINLKFSPETIKSWIFSFLNEEGVKYE